MRDVIAIIVQGKKLVEGTQVDFEPRVVLKYRSVVDEVDVAAEIFVAQEEIEDKWLEKGTIYWIVTIHHRGETWSREYCRNPHMPWLIRELIEEVFEYRG